MCVSASGDTKRRRVIATVSVVAALALLIGGLVWLVIWAQGRERPAPVRAEPFEQYRPAWESAMRKAGVEATFPAGPVDLSAVRATGATPFSADFTAEEVAALMTVYRFDYEAQGAGTVSVRRPSVEFPEAGWGRLSGRLLFDGSAYKARLEAPATFEDGEVVVGSAGSGLTVEGFSVGGERKTQAVAMVEIYLNALVRAAPGLSVERARIEAGSLRVEGVAPSRLEHPEAEPWP
jgi:hypothetical protein